MKRTLLFVALVATGFLLKFCLVEAERYVHVSLVDRCLAQYQTPTREQETACYLSPREHAGYRVIAFLSFQPQLWKNLKGRCVEAKDNADEYFECGWWNHVAL